MNCTLICLPINLSKQKKNGKILNLNHREIKVEKTNEQKERTIESARIYEVKRNALTKDFTIYKKNYAPNVRI